MNTFSSNDKKDKIKTLKDYLLIIVGSIITALGTNIFLIPNKIAPGGLTGVATVIYHLSNGIISPGLTMLVLNIPLFIIGVKYIGKKFIFKTLVGTVLLSLFIDIFKPFTDQLAGMLLLSGSEPLNNSPDLLLYSVYGGLFIGIGIGLIFRVGGTTGGSDLAAKLVHHFFPGFTIGQTLTFIDIGIVVFATIAFKSFILGLYAIITLFVMSRIIDAIIEGVNFAKAVYIISDKASEIGENILYDLDRGITALKGTGMYTGKEREVLMCVLHRSQISQLKQIVKSIDQDAFVILADVREVLGEGFKSHND